MAFEFWTPTYTSSGDLTVPRHLHQFPVTLVLLGLSQLPIAILCSAIKLVTESAAFIWGVFLAENTFFSMLCFFPKS